MSQSASPRVYARRQPEKDPLHQVLSAHLMTFLDQAEHPEEQEQTLWDKLCAASVQGRIAMGPKAGWRVRRLGSHPVLLPPGEQAFRKEVVPGGQGATKKGRNQSSRPTKDPP